MLNKKREKARKFSNKKNDQKFHNVYFSYTKIFINIIYIYIDPSASNLYEACHFILYSIMVKTTN